MAVQHKDLKDPVLHEPKGLGTPENPLVTAGRVYVSDGAGSGSWQLPADPTPPASSFGDKVIISTDFANIPVILAATNDPNLLDFRDYVAFTNLFTAAPESSMSFTAEGEFIIEVTGIYQFNFWLSESNDINNGELGISLYRNLDLPLSALPGPTSVFGPVLRDRTKTITDITAMSASGILELNAGDVVGIAMASKVATAGQGVDISDGSISFILLEDLT